MFRSVSEKIEDEDMPASFRSAANHNPANGLRITHGSLLIFRGAFVKMRWQKAFLSSIRLLGSTFD
jgi:hypothetical protein